MGGDIREKWIFIPFVIVYFQYFFVRINSAGMCYQEGCSTNCYNCTLVSENDSRIVVPPQQQCNGTCPVGFYLSSYSQEEVSCMYIYSTISTSPSGDYMNATSFKSSTATIPTATPTLLTSISATLNATSLKDYTATSDLGHSTTTTTLLTSTSATLERIIFCLKCNEICVSCEGSATNCTQYQITTESKKDQQPLAIIIGASVGGGLALIITTVIIVCFVCRCRKRRDTTRMSGILQGRTEGGEKRDDDVTIPPSTNPIYENVERQNEFVDQIPEQGDRILRYARDPTTIDKKKEPKQTDPTRSSSYYQNSATIRRQDNIQDISAVPEEHKELEQLGQAPLPPTVKKKSLKKRVSNKIKQLTGKVPQKASPISDQETQEEHYLPMGPMESSHQEVYEEMEDKLHQNSPTLFAQENYENVEDTLADVPSVVAPPPPPLEQEDYENIKDRFPVPERARTGQKSNSRMPDPPTGAKISQTSSGSKDNKLSEEYINVEKYKQTGPESSKKDDLTSQETTEDLEDYENVKYFNKRK